jgi:hypothetical protein
VKFILFLKLFFRTFAVPGVLLLGAFFLWTLLSAESAGDAEADGKHEQSWPRGGPGSPADFAIVRGSGAIPE